MSNRGKGKRSKKKKKKHVTLDENVIVMDRSRLEILKADLRGSRFLIAALVQRLGGKVTIDPREVGSDQNWEIVRKDERSGIITLELKGNVPKRIIEGPDTGAGEKGETDDVERSSAEMA